MSIILPVITWITITVSICIAEVSKRMVQAIRERTMEKDGMSSASGIESNASMGGGFGGAAAAKTVVTQVLMQPVAGWVSTDHGKIMEFYFNHAKILEFWCVLSKHHGILAENRDANFRSKFLLKLLIFLQIIN